MKRKLLWIVHRTPPGSWHLFGSRVAFGRFFGTRIQILISPRLSKWRRFSFGWGKRL